MIPLPKISIMETPFVDIHTHNTETSPAGVIRIVNYGLLKELPPTTQNAAFSYGVHPWWFDEHPESEFLERQLGLLEKMLDDNRLFAIGETGIDKIHKDTMTQQLQSFERHILLSERYRKPLIIHNVRGTQEILGLRKTMRPSQPWIIHGFNGSREEAIQLCGQGLYLSVGADLLYENRKIRKSIPSIPLDHLLLETDTSAYSIQEVYQEAAASIGVPLALLKRHLFASVGVFGL